MTRSRLFEFMLSRYTRDKGGVTIKLLDKAFQGEDWRVALQELSDLGLIMVFEDVYKIHPRWR
jgi:hypothetical protein